MRPMSRRLVVPKLDSLDILSTHFVPFLTVLYSRMGYVCGCFRCLYAYKHASSFYCRRGIAFSYFRPLVIISLLLNIVIVTLVVELVVEVHISSHALVISHVQFPFSHLLGTSSEVWPIPLAFLVYQSWPLGDGELVYWFTRFRMMQIN